MNLFLKNGRSFQQNNPKHLSDLKIKSKFSKNSSPTKGNEHINQFPIINHKKTSKNLTLKISYESPVKSEIIETEPLINKNKLKTHLSKTLEIEKNENNKKINFSAIKNGDGDVLYKSRSNTKLHKVDKDNSFDSRKSLISLTKRKSMLTKEKPELFNKYGLSSATNVKSYKLLSSFNDYPKSPDTHFSSNHSEKSKFPKNIFKELERNRRASLLLIADENFHEEIKLKELKKEINKFEISGNFLPNEKLIKKNLSSPEKFINKKYERNRYFKKNQLIKKTYPTIVRKKLIFSFSSKKPKKRSQLFNAINTIEKDSEIHKKDFQNIKNDNDYEKTEKMLKNSFKKIDLMNDEVAEYLKELVIDYKKEIGDFTFFGGRGIYSNHLAKIKKNENRLAFMISNDID